MLATTTDTTLTTDEQDHLRALEATIDRGLQSFVEVGAALKAISAAKLYRADYATFEDYVEKRWGFGRRSAYAYMTAAHVAVNVQRVAQPTYRQALSLVGLRPDEQVEVVKRVDLTRVTSDQLRQHAKEMYPLGPSQQRELAERRYDKDAWEIVEAPRSKLYDVVAAVCDLMIAGPMAMPPNPQQVLPLLVEGGSFLYPTTPVYLHIASVLHQNTGELHTHWTLALVPDTNESTEIITHKVDSTWTPILWFTKGEYLGGYVTDTAKTLSQFALRLSGAGDTVCEIEPDDASVAIAVLKAERRYIGVVSDTEKAERLRDELRAGQR